MKNIRNGKPRKIKMRSYRQICQILLAFGSAGLALGIGLVGFFGLKGNMKLAAVGFVYVLVSGMLLGVRGVLAYIGTVNRQRRLKSSARRIQQT